MQDNMTDRLEGATARFWDETVLGNASDVESQSAPVAAANGVASLYGLHSILKYDQYGPDTDPFYNDNSVASCFEVITQTGADNDMMSHLNMFFTPVPPYYGIQQCLSGSPVLDDQFQAYMDQRHIAVDNGKTTSLFQELAKHHVEYVYKTKGKPLWPDDDYVVKNIRPLFSITKAGSFRNAKLAGGVYELCETVRASLRTAGLPSSPLDADGLISFLWPILNPESMFNKEPFPDLRYDDRKSIKDQATVFGQHVRVKANELLFGLPPEKQGDKDKRITVRSFGVLQCPQKKELWEMTSIIGSFFDDDLQYPCPFLVCDDVFTFDPNVVDGKAQIKAARTK